MRRIIAVVGSIALVTSLGLAVPAASEENDDVSVRAGAPALAAPASVERPKKTECATDDPGWVTDGIATMRRSPWIYDEFFSLEVAPEVTEPVGLNPGGYQRLWDMGVAWKDVNPKEDTFNWSVLDQRVQQAEAAGAKPLYVLGLTPSWAATSDAGDRRWGIGTASAPKDLNMWRTYVREVANRYNGKNGHGRIYAYEVWNEANIATFWDNGDENSPDPFGMGILGEMTKIAYDEIKAAEEWNVVITATTTTRVQGQDDFFGGPQRRYWHYLQALKAQNYPFDAWGIHSYPAGNEGPTERMEDVTCWQEMVVRHFGPEVVAQQADNMQHPLNRRILDTEVNYGLAGPGDAIPGTSYDGDIAQRLVWRTYIDSARLGIDSTVWYLYTDRPYQIGGQVVGAQMYGDTAAVQAYGDVRGALIAGEDFEGCDDIGVNETAPVYACLFPGLYNFTRGVNIQERDYLTFAENVFSDGTPVKPFVARFNKSWIPKISTGGIDERFDAVSGSPILVTWPRGVGSGETLDLPTKPAVIYWKLAWPEENPKQVRLVVRWEPGSKAEAPFLQGYQVEIQACDRSDRCTVVEAFETSVKGTKDGMGFFVDRSTATKYRFRLRAKNRSGFGPWYSRTFVTVR